MDQEEIESPPTSAPEEAETAQFSDELLSSPKGDSLIKDVKQAVFSEYDRALLEGTASKEAIELNKKHLETVDELVQLNISALRENDTDITPAQERTCRLYAYLHDALKLVPEREKLEGEHKAESLAQSGESSGTTRLLMHGEDSVEWAEQLLTDLNLSPQFIEKTKADLITHMGMPYVETVLKDVSKSQPEAKGYPFPTKTKLTGIEVDEYGRTARKLAYPRPQTPESAILFVADLLSPMVMAGENIDQDPAAGCFDRYVNINLELSHTHRLSLGLENAFKSSSDTLRNNVDRLRLPPDKPKRPLAAKIETTLAREIGIKAIAKLNEFTAALRKGLEMDGRTVNSLDQLDVWDEETYTEKGPEGDKEVVFENINPPKTMKNYYKAVRAFRQKSGLDASQIENR